MPRQTRKARKAKAKKITPPALVEQAPRETPAESISWNIQQRIMIRCPCCGRVGEPSFTSRRTGVAIGISEGPFELEVFWQRFGGSMPSPTGGMRDRAGFMEYSPAADQLEEWRPIIIEKLKAALEQLEE
jgi:hypothetical protein